MHLRAGVGGRLRAAATSAFFADPLRIAYAFLNRRQPHVRKICMITR